MKRLLLGASLMVSACIPPVLCIARGARVRTPKGDRPIEDLAVGDEVVCVDPDLGVTHSTRVTWRRVSKRECITLSFSGGSLQCTTDHPLYCPESKGWHPAGDWALGKRTSLLRVDGKGQRVVKVESVSMFSGVHEVFDLTVEHELHNFVADGILVHNKSPARQTCADGQLEESPCTCGGGSTGLVLCDPATNQSACTSCVPGDAGQPIPDGGVHLIVPNSCPRVTLQGPLPQVFEGDTTGLANTLTSARLEWTDAPDDSLQFTAPEAGNYVIELQSPVTALGVSAQDYGTMGTDARPFTTSDCPLGTSVREINGVYNHNQPNFPLALTAGQRVVLFVSAPYWANQRFGPYTLTVRKLP